MHTQPEQAAAGRIQVQENFFRTKSAQPERAAKPSHLFALLWHEKRARYTAKVQKKSAKMQRGRGDRRRAALPLCMAGMSGAGRPAAVCGGKMPPLFERGRVWRRFQGDSFYCVTYFGQSGLARRKAFFASFLSPHKKDGPRGRAEPANRFKQVFSGWYAHGLKGRRTHAAFQFRKV
ncbi:hypothetical protein Ethha_0230 [Ethanoligenens harbinense YUAN-3]|uniref:Uncharacterized protein n=1 Tax=Ethanoligenens harbinense (strain DSM 18485 / JCM 12961 / CGMCC 1.5033 / YUAN-3) TaxID=663278 RepID=E6U782_ETHHY|nr:hypothetical protein Ethha_0230 [Ethanoligenens harbinense YUAN-3]AYF40392.1 hypothetical protein CN246_01175 [Ethanoligenens harbinense]